VSTLCALFLTILQWTLSNWILCKWSTFVGFICWMRLWRMEWNLLQSAT
jgi:hypothetical protein